MNNGQNPTTDLLSAYHDGELSAVEREAAERLLAESAAARAELEDYQRLSAELRSLPDDAPPVDVAVSVLASIREHATTETSEHSTKTKSRRAWRYALPLGLAGAIAASVLALAAWQFRDDWGSLGMPVAGRQTETASRGVEATPDMATESMAADAREPSERAGPMRAPESGATASGGATAAPALGNLAGENARPPAGFNVGDIYSYIDRTDAGEIVVVQAYVVDVRRAVNQMQVLLARNSIPTTEVSRLSDETLNLAIPTTAPRNDLALYVESDPERIKMAFQDLQGQFELKSNAFQGLRVSGILESDGAGSGMGGGMGGMGMRAYDFQRKPPREATKPDKIPLAKSGAARLSEAKPTDDASADRLQENLGFEKKATKTPSEPAPALAAGKNTGSAPRFQTVVNVSNGIILEQLQRQKRGTGTEAEEATQYFYLDQPLELKTRKRYGSPNGAAVPEKSANQTRLLLVIQQGPAPPPSPADHPTDDGASEPP